MSSILSFAPVARHSRSAMEDELQRIFSTFPSGWPGIGLLLLRVVVGVVAVAEASGYLIEGGGLGPITLGVIAGVSGVLLLIGYMTPLAGTLLGTLSLLSALAWVPKSMPNMITAGFPSASTTVMVVALLCLGPGALSLDANLFGRREIVISDNPR